MAEQIQVIVGLLEDVAASVVKKLTLDVTALLQSAPVEGGTPVDTGWARANWVPRIGGPFTGSGDANEVGGEGGAPAAVGARRAESEAGQAQVALRYKLEQGPVYVTNNVPYIGRLNAGSSKQAEAGFVERAVERAATQGLFGLSTP